MRPIPIDPYMSIQGIQSLPNFRSNPAKVRPPIIKAMIRKRKSFPIKYLNIKNVIRDNTSIIPSNSTRILQKNPGY